MAKKRKRKKRSNAGLYMLVFLCLATSGISVWGIAQKLFTYGESANAYQELQQLAVVRNQQPLAGDGGAEAPAQQANQEAAPEEGAFSQEADIQLEGLEEQEVSQEDTLWFIANDAPIDFTMPHYFAGGQQRDQEEGQPTQAVLEAEVLAMPSASASGPDMNASGSATAKPQTEATTAPTPTPTALDLSSMAALAGELAQKVDLSGQAAPLTTEEPGWQRFVEREEVRYTVNFPYLETLNEDVRAWLIQEDTDINYPVMQTEDNTYYLNRLFNHAKNDGGSLFMDSGNSTYFVDANTYIYGHNTKAGTMFASLGNYQDQAYYEAHPQMILLTPYSDFCIDIFACTMSLVEDETSWRIKQFSRKVDFEQYVKELKAQSFFKTDVEPEWGDQWVALVTCTNVRHGQRFVVYGRMRPIRYTTEETQNLTKVDMDARLSISGRRQVGLLGEMVGFVQNDPLWESIRYEGRTSKKKRGFGDGGAAAVAVANAVVNMVPQEELTRLTGYSNAEAGYTFCTCSVNQYYCNRKHAQYQIQTPEEFTRYLPMALASFTTGNNLWQDEARTNKSGASMRFIEYISGIYGLKLTPSLDGAEALAALDRGGMVVASVETGKNPFTRGSHYITLVGAEGDHLYIMDPYLTEQYTRDRSNILERVDQNVLRVWKGHLDKLAINAYYILEKPQETPEESQEEEASAASAAQQSPLPSEESPGSLEESAGEDVFSSSPPGEDDQDDTVIPQEEEASEADSFLEDVQEESP